MEIYKMRYISHHIQKYIQGDYILIESKTKHFKRSYLYVIWVGNTFVNKTNRNFKEVTSKPTQMCLTSIWKWDIKTIMR